MKIFVLWIVFCFIPQGAPPIPAPYALPKSFQQNSGNETRSDNSDSETPDSEPDEDNLSTLAGVTLVTAAINDLSFNEQTPRANNASSIGKRIVAGHGKTATFKALFS